MKFKLSKSLALAAFAVAFMSVGVRAEDTKKSLESLKTMLNKYGEPKTDGVVTVGDKSVPVLMFGSKKVNLNYEVVDAVKKVNGGNATIFVKSGDDYVRVSTNVLKDDGTRAIGTVLAKNKAYEAINKGETFCGVVDILGKPYDTCYEPIKNSKAETLGIYYVGYPK